MTMIVLLAMLFQVSSADFHDHAAWTALLRRYVNDDGLVDYRGMKDMSGPAMRNGQIELGEYLKTLESVSAQSYGGFTRQQKLAFWINAYNAYTVRLILDHYPVKSIRSIGLLPEAAFRKRFIPLDKLRGRKLSLNDIEHEILRKELHEPRIHFALVCAARSCPVLRREAYRGAEVDSQLDDAARRFLRDPSRNRFDPGTRTLYLSSIFKWFKEDFESAAGSVVAYVARFVDQAVARELARPGVRIEHLDYDWSLNGK